MVSDNSFTNNMSAVDRIYATHAGVEQGKHLDVENLVEETDVVEVPGGPVRPPAPEVPEDADPDDLTEEELEAATAPEGDD
jgi:hypothetical protein